MKFRFLLVLFAAVLLAAGWLMIRRPASAPVDATPTPDDPIAARPARKPRLPAPPLPVTHPTPEAPDFGSRPTNWIAQLLNGEWPAQPSRQAIEAYLADNRRNAASLLAAFRISGDAALLDEAAKNYPQDPQVAFASFTHSKSPEERRRWLDALKQAAPDDALASYLSAGEYFKAGQTDLAIGDLVAAAGQAKWQDYSREFILNAEEAYRAAGYSEAEAKAAAGLGLPLPHLARLREVGQQVGDLARLYRQAGDEASAQAALQLGVGMARRISDEAGPHSLIQDLVGMATERIVLRDVDPASAYDTAGRTVQDRLSELTQRCDDITQIGKQTETIMSQLTERELIGFIERWKISGELEALRWVLATRTPP